MQYDNGLFEDAYVDLDCIRAGVEREFNGP